MDITIGGGRAWGIPLAGGGLSVRNASARDIVSAGVGLASTLVALSALPAALDFAAALLSHESEPADNFPISAMALVSTPSRKINSVVLTETLEIECEGDTLKIPTRMIHFVASWGSDELVNMNLVDGSHYSLVRIKTPIVTCLGVAGIQRVSLLDRKVRITGHTPADLDALRSKLLNALNRSADDVVRVIGENAFKQFFILEDSTRTKFGGA